MRFELRAASFVNQPMASLDKPACTRGTEDKQPNIELLRFEFEKEKGQAELAARERDLLLREREQANQDADIELKRKEQATSKWRSPLVVAIFAAAIAGVGNAGVAALNGWYQRDLDGSKRDAERALEENKAESTRALEMIKTGDTETAAKQLAFLLDTGLVTEPIRVGNLREFLAHRRPGTGPALPSPSRFGFEPSDLPSSVQAVLQANLENYIRYLDDIGFP